ncbi:helix-turn-helix domain-containing protein [Shewanella sp. SM20]|nr:helix-turn-helix transcriptional regulator [Shewanella sp. SM20]MCU8092602.1 helix-turn-helix domain-containing protein [Shewanella sp. SM20]
MRKMRKLRGLSQDELALREEIDRSYIGRIERAEVNLTLDMYKKPLP